jgi:hypothetical protein
MLMLSFWAGMGPNYTSKSIHPKLSFCKARGKRKKPRDFCVTKATRQCSAETQNTRSGPKPFVRYCSSPARRLSLNLKSCSALDRGKVGNKGPSGTASEGLAIHEAVGTSTRGFAPYFVQPPEGQKPWAAVNVRACVLRGRV